LTQIDLFYENYQKKEKSAGLFPEMSLKVVEKNGIHETYFFIHKDGEILYF